MTPLPRSRWLFVLTYLAWIVALCVWPSRMMFPTVVLLSVRALLDDILKRLQMDRQAAHTPNHPSDLPWLLSRIEVVERRLDASAPICEQVAQKVLVADESRTR